MPNDIFYIKRNDLQPYYYVKAQKSTGASIDLTGATIKAIMKEVNLGTLKVNTSTGVTITAASIGEFHYQFPTSTTDTTGHYAIEFEVEPSSGGKFTLPVNRDSRIIVVPDENSE